MAVRALLIGCNYPGTMSELGGCVNDAHDWADELEGRPNIASIEVLTNRQASKRNVHKRARKLLDSLEIGDWFWFWFSGHGSVEVDESGDEGSGYDQAIVYNDFSIDYDDEFADMLASRRYPNQTFGLAGLDCCHSRTMHRGAKRPRTIPFNRCRAHVREANRVPAPPALPGVVMLAGCGEGKTEYSYDAEFEGRGNGAFSFYALQMIRTLECGATFADWFRLIGGRRPRGALPSHDYPQQPAYQATRSMMRRAIPIL